VDIIKAVVLEETWCLNQNECKLNAPLKYNGTLCFSTIGGITIR